MILVAHALAADAPDPVELNRLARKVEVRHLSILGAWAGVNLVGGTVGFLTTNNPRLQGFHATNAAWNTVNAALALGGLFGGRNRSLTLADVQERHRKLRRALSINIGLDVFYVAGGVSLMVAGGELERPMLRGVGQSVFLQGAFLTVFDLVFLDSHHAIDRKVAVSLTSNGVVVAARW